jgi:hypothetical protein
MQYSNSQLTLPTLVQIMQQFRLAHGLYPYEISFEMYALPRVSVGQIIQFTDYTDLNGVVIPLPPAIVVELNIEVAVGKEMVTTGRALYWRDT